MAIRYIETIKPRSAKGAVKKVYKQLRREMGDVVEPISLHAILPDLLEASWGVLRETLLVEDQLTRNQKEAIAAAVSVSNKCTYCVDAHTIMLIGLKDKELAGIIEGKELDEIKDDNLKELMSWSFRTTEFESLDSKLLLLSKNSIPEAIGVAVIFHYLNRLVTIFLGETILPMNIKFLKGMMKGVAAKMFSNVLSKEISMGSFDSLHSIESPLIWASGNERLYFYFHTFYNAVNSQVRKYFDEDVLGFLQNQIEDWDGSQTIDAKSFEKQISELSESVRPIARILHLACFNPFKIHQSHIHQFHSLHLGRDKALLAAVSWASFITSCRIGRELYRPYRN